MDANIHDKIDWIGKRVQFTNGTDFGQTDDSGNGVGIVDGVVMVPDGIIFNVTRSDGKPFSVGHEHCVFSDERTLLIRYIAWASWMQLKLEGLGYREPEFPKV